MSIHYTLSMNRPRLMIKTSRVRIPAPDTICNIRSICCKKFESLIEKTENKAGKRPVMVHFSNKLLPNKVSFIMSYLLLQREQLTK